uniref:CAP10 domain-containing protein n=1 Tax=Heligmosomoides polygyrus TaxID=6339 RepID=A0A183FU41_HELPZ
LLLTKILQYVPQYHQNTVLSADFFLRSAKWIPSGGAGLVSGRGNFRPGFTGRDWRSAMAEPNFKKVPWFNDEY